jgi:succinate dehydrogenase / fumarate reductase cytochrome b subunit
MALTGLALLGFVIAHMLGNLQVFAGRDKLNAYAKTLQDLGPLLWVMRGGLLALFVVHVGCAVRVALWNQAARPTPYASVVPQVSSYAGRTMLMSGLIVAAFVVYHLLHFTLGVTNPAHAALVDDKGRHDVYGMVVAGFQQWPIAIAYVVAQLLLFFHLSHGASSAFQTLGVSHPRLAFLKGRFGTVLAAVIFLGNCSIPLSIATGLVPCAACGGR